MIAALAFFHFDPIGVVRPFEETEVVSCRGQTVGIDGRKAELLRLHNEIRAEHSVVQFCVHNELMIAAQGHAEDMMSRGFYAHETPEGVTPAARVSNAGYDFVTTGENNNMINKSYSGEPDRDELKDAVKSWMESPGHRDNMLNPAFREVGIGLSTGSYAGEPGTTTMYVVEFGSRS